MTTLARWLRRVGISLLPLLTGLWVAATSFAGGSFLPWRPTMVDLDVYRRVGEVVLTGGDVYTLPGSLPFLYPPFAALVAVALTWPPTWAMQVLWVGINVGCLLAILYRVGIRGWLLSLLASFVIVAVEPVAMTLAFGQVGIILTALVVLDVMPGGRFLTGRGSGDPARRWLPEGFLSGIATAVKLTPGITLPYLVLAGRRRAGLWVAGGFAAVTLLAAAVLPSASLGFWGRLAHGDSGLGNSIIYLTNQSVMGTWLRILRLAPGSTVTGLLACAAVAALGVWAAALWHRLGQISLAVCLSGVAGLLASPVSWSHHFVWVVPLAVVLWRSAIPLPVRVCGYLFVGWVAVAPFKRLPGGGDVELTYTGGQILLSSITTGLGLLLLILCVAAGQAAWAARDRTTEPRHDLAE